MRFRACLFSTALLLTAAAAAMDDPPTFAVSGVVVNSVSGQPVPRALVWMAGPSRHTVFTGSDGSFKFAGVASGEYFLAAEKPGFSYDLKLETRRQASLQVSADVSKLVVKLLPEGIISGRIEDPEHEPLPNTYVGVAAYDVQNGRRHLERRGATRTDEDGNYRIAGLKQDDYFIVAGSTGTVPPVTSKSGDQHDWGYAFVAYPNVDTLSSASAVHVDPGQHVDASFSLKPKRTFHVNGRVIGMPQVAAPVWFQREDFPFYGIYVGINAATGEFHARWLPAGDYIVYVSVRGDTPLVAEQRLTVGSDLDGVQLELAPPVKVPVTIRWDSPPEGAAAGKERFFAMVELVPDEWWGSTVRQNGNATTDFSINNVYPGHYTVHPRVFAGNARVASMTMGDVDLLQHKLTVTTAALPQPIEIVLTSDSGKIEAHVPTGQQCWVVAVPVVATGLDPPMGFCDPNGVAQVTQVGPGDYNVYLLDTLDNVPYAEPEFAKANESRAVRVTVPPKGTVTVTPSLIRVSK